MINKHAPRRSATRAVVAALGAALIASSLTACVSAESHPDPQERQAAIDYAARYAQMSPVEKCEHEVLTPEDVFKCRQAQAAPSASKPDPRHWTPIDAKPMMLSWAVLLESGDTQKVVRVYKTDRGPWGVERSAENTPKLSADAHWACMVYEEAPECRERQAEAEKSAS